MGEVQLDIKLLVRLSQFAVLVPLCVGCIHRSTLDPSQRLLLWLVGLSAFTEAAAYAADVLALPYNTPVYNLFAVLQILLYNRLFAQLLPWPLLKTWFNAPLLLLLVFGAINLIWLQPMIALQTNLIVAAMVVHIGFAMGYLQHYLKTSTATSIFAAPMLWFAIGVLFYSLGTILLYAALSRMVGQTQSSLLSPWSLNALLFILLNLFYAIALWKKAPN